MSYHKQLSVVWSLVFLFAAMSVNAGLPFTFENHSEYADNEIYIAVIGKIGGHVWIDPQTGAVKQMNVSDNTAAGPQVGGNKGPGGNGLYADCFRKLSDIPDKKITLPIIAGSRILISFGSPLYLYFFGYAGDPSGYAAPNLANPTDPNQGIRFEMIELTYDAGGVWANTTRVDAFQHPMGLEMWGDGGFYKKTGEIVKAETIIDLWKSEVPSAFQGCLNEKEGVIHAPSKIADFQDGGKQTNYFKSYVDAIWSKYATTDLIFDSGDAGIWKGRVEGERFVFHNLTNSFGNATGIISRRPNTQEVLEGKGVLAEDVQKLPTQQLDLVVQAQFCAAVNRHAIDLNAAEGVTQKWKDSTLYYNQEPYNAYAEFWHRADISWLQSSYGFCYDDVFDYSSTIHTAKPQKALVTIGGFYQEPTAMRIKARQTDGVDMCPLRVGNAIRYQGESGVYDLRGRLQ